MILGCYNSGALAEPFQKKPIAEQIALSRAAIEKVHPGHGADLANPTVINWNKVPYSLGPWPNWGSVGGQQEGHFDTPAYRALQKPEGRVYFAGAMLSQTPGWQEGGIHSAWKQVSALTQRTVAEVLTTPRARRAAFA
jgi:monoamine oxidase